MKNIVSQFGLGALNQAVSSISNFLIVYYLLRILSPDDFGVYNIGFSCMLAIAGVLNSMLLTQMVVNYFDVPAEKRGYENFVVLGSVIFSCVILIILALVGDFLINIFESKYGYFFTSISIAILGYVCKEYFIKIFFNEDRVFFALVVNSLVFVLVIIIFVIICRDFELNGNIALVLYGVSNFLGSFLLVRAIKGFGEFPSLVDVFDCLKKSWANGKYSVLAHLVVTGRTQAHTLILAFILGPVGVALANASRIFVMPVLIMQQAIGQVILPKLVRFRKDGGSDYSYELANASKNTTTGTILFSLAVIFLYDHIEFLVPTNKYSGLFFGVVCWCFFAVCSNLRNWLELSMVAEKRFVDQARINFYGSVVAVIIGGAGCVFFGYCGGIVALAASEIAFIAFVLGGKK